MGFIFLFILKKDTITELPPLILPNTGNMGIPICLFAYGTEGLRAASAIASVIILFSLYYRCFIGQKKFFTRYFSKNVPIYGIIIAVLFLYFEWDVPGYIENTTFLLTYTTIFL